MRDLQERKKLIERGMQLAATLPDITPDHASEEVKAIYNDIQNILRVPLVNQLFRTLANYPEYLEQLWQHFRPAFSSNSFELEADNLREKALMEALPEIDEAIWQELDIPEQLRDFQDTIYYVLPKLLLAASTFYEAASGSIPEPRSRRGEAPVSNTQIAAGIAAGTTSVALVDPKTERPELKKLFGDIKQQHGLSLLSSYYRGMANWPPFLEQAWLAIKPLVGNSEYENLKSFIVDQAQMSMRRLPIRQPELKEVDKEQQEEVIAVLAFFRYKFIPEMLLEAALIKALLDGPAEAYTSRFSVAVQED
ncbi:short-chain dehydrogenase/reductase SDR [Flammeovirgaceae bacterium 311]|nr:short-chain dehydrogenase/reductase SDR [Flammeovirgaceae bacterium 311]